jgi:nitrogenase iron protein NifH
VYRRLAQRVADHTESKVPAPLTTRELRDWSSGWADRLIETERGNALLANAS